MLNGERLPREAREECILIIGGPATASAWFTTAGTEGGRNARLGVSELVRWGRRARGRLAVRGCRGVPRCHIQE
jgi:hypothetical protein